jgi:hypothetical protein
MIAAMTPRPLRRAALLLTSAAALLALAMPASAAPAAAPDRVLQTVTLRTVVSSAGSTLETLPGGVTYGWNDLRGSTRWAGRNAQIRFLGDVDYRRGTGNFNGYVTVTRNDGARLAFRVVGWAEAKDPDTAETAFTGTIRILGGTGEYRGARGTGTMTGYRSAQLGSPVNMRFALTVSTRS